MKNKLLLLFEVVGVAAISLVTILPLFHSGFFPMHDNTQVQRVFEMQKALRDGMFPVRWVDDLGYGYGYPLFNFYGPFAYYVGGILAFFIDILSATKVMLGIAMVGSGVAMYSFAKSFWGKWGGIASAVLYLFAPYHALNLYVRGDIGELWAYLFLPLLGFGLYRLYGEFLAFEKHNRGKAGLLISSFKTIFLAGVGLAGIIISHNLSAFMAIPFFAAVVIVIFFTVKNKILVAGSLMLMLIIALGLSGFYWIPVFAEMKYTNVLSQVGGGADFHTHFVCLSQLWQSQWGFGGSAPGCVDGLSFMVGKLNIIFSILALILLPFLRKQRHLLVVSIISLIGLGVSIFLMLSISQIFWEKIPQMAFLQYPWRYLSFASFFSSLSAGAVVYIALKKKRLMGIGLAVLLVSADVLLGFKYFHPQAYIAFSPEKAISFENLQWKTSKISDEYLPRSFVKPTSLKELPHLFIVSTSGITLQNQKEKTQKKEAALSVTTAQEVFLNLAYFPAWQAYDNGRQIPLLPTKHGTKVFLPPGMHTLILSYKGTFVENLSNIISLTSVAIIILGIIWEIAQRYDQKST